MQSPLWYYTAAVVAWSLLTGGATTVGFPADVVGQFLAIPLLVWALAEWWTRAAPATVDNQPPAEVVSRWLPLPLLIAAGLVVIQLLPISLNTSHSALVTPSQFGINNLTLLPDSWSSISVTPQATLLAGLSLLAPMAVFVAAGTMNRAQRKDLVQIVIAIGLLSLLLGVLQIAQGNDSPLRFYTVTNNSEAVGLFANRNHFAAQLYIILVLGGAWLASRAQQFSLNDFANPRNALQLAVFVAAITLIIAGIVTARSRAGIALMFIAMLALALLFVLGNKNSGTMDTKPAGSRLSVYLLAAIVLFVLVFGAQNILSRANSDFLEDLRWTYLTTTLSAIWNTLPFGSGLGSFVNVYGILEGYTDSYQFYANRAHNDLAELVLETGVIGIALVVLFLGWFAIRTLAIWKAPDNGDRFDNMLQRAATIVIALILLHSLVDYPLRTTAHGVMFALACALLLSAPPTRRSKGTSIAPSLKPRHTKAVMPQTPQRPEEYIPATPSTPWQGEHMQWPEAWETPGPSDKR